MLGRVRDALNSAACLAGDFRTGGRRFAYSPLLSVVCLFASEAVACVDPTTTDTILTECSSLNAQLTFVELCNDRKGAPAVCVRGDGSDAFRDAVSAHENASYAAVPVSHPESLSSFLCHQVRSWIVRRKSTEVTLLFPPRPPQPSGENSGEDGAGDLSLSLPAVPCIAWPMLTPVASAPSRIDAVCSCHGAPLGHHAAVPGEYAQCPLSPGQFVTVDRAPNLVRVGGVMWEADKDVEGEGRGRVGAAERERPSSGDVTLAVRARLDLGLLHEGLLHGSPHLLGLDPMATVEGGEGMWETAMAALRGKEEALIATAYYDLDAHRYSVLPLHYAVIPALGEGNGDGEGEGNGCEGRAAHVAIVKRLATREELEVLDDVAAMVNQPAAAFPMEADVIGHIRGIDDVSEFTLRVDAHTDVLFSHLRMRTVGRVGPRKDKAPETKNTKRRR